MERDDPLTESVLISSKYAVVTPAMKLSLYTIVRAAILAGASSGLAFGVAISGSISFDGVPTFNGGADANPATLADNTAFTAFTGVTANSQHFGTYSVVPTGTSATFSPFTFSPTGSVVTPLATFNIGGTTYAFNGTVTSASYAPSLSQWNIGGTGTAFITGFDPTLGTWTLSALAVANVGEGPVFDPNNDGPIGGPTTVNYSFSYKLRPPRVSPMAAQPLFWWV